MVYFQKRIKIWSYLTLFLAGYVLLNVFIGFSSAPFYERFALCNRYEPDIPCQELQKKVRRLYISELAGGVLTLIQGLIGVVLVDNLKSMKIIHALRKICKISVVLYLIAFIIRVCLYLDVHSAIKTVDIDHNDKGLGSFLAEYIDDTTGSVLISIFLLVFFLSFYLSNFWIVKLMNKLLDFMDSKAEEYLIS